MIVVSGSVIGSPKASPGCKAPGVSGVLIAGGDFSPGAGLCACAGRPNKASTRNRALGAAIRHDITFLRRSGAAPPGESQRRFNVIVACPLANLRKFAI